jgi:hypothetical protein
MTRKSPRPAWKPTASTWIVGAIVILCLVAFTASSGIGGFLMGVALAALVTSMYVLVTRRPSWARLPRSRPIALASTGGALVLLIVASAIGGATAAPTAGHASKQAAPAHTVAPKHSAPARTSATRIQLAGFEGDEVTSSHDALINEGLNVVVKTADGSIPPDDLTGWVIVSEDPASGTTVNAGTTVTIIVRPAATPTPTAVAAPPPPVPAVAPKPAPVHVAPVKPAPPAPVKPAPPAAPAYIIPGAFCSPSLVGQSGLAANGRTYVCGGKGADASGHYHWNV